MTVLIQSESAQKNLAFDFTKCVGKDVDAYEVYLGKPAKNEDDGKDRARTYTSDALKKKGVDTIFLATSNFRTNSPVNLISIVFLPESKIGLGSALRRIGLDPTKLKRVGPDERGQAIVELSLPDVVCAKFKRGTDEGRAIAQLKGPGWSVFWMNPNRAGSPQLTIDELTPGLSTGLVYDGQTGGQRG